MLLIKLFDTKIKYFNKNHTFVRLIFDNNIFVRYLYS
jgi:hypothetical protein